MRLAYKLKLEDMVALMHIKILHLNSACGLALNLALEWRDAHPYVKGNIRDYATINELICLSNMENLNAVFINEGLLQKDRLIKLNQIAIQQMSILENINKKLLK